MVCYALDHDKGKLQIAYSSGLTPVTPQAASNPATVKHLKISFSIAQLREDYIRPA